MERPGDGGRVVVEGGEGDERWLFDMNRLHNIINSHHYIKNDEGVGQECNRVDRSDKEVGPAPGSKIFPSSLHIQPQFRDGGTLHPTIYAE